MLRMLLISLILVSCSSVKRPFEPESFKKGLYRKDMKIQANGYKGRGAVVVPQKDKYDLKIWAAGKLDLFTMQSCHREITQEDAGYKGGFLGFGRNKKLALLEYKPVGGLEDKGSCPVDFGGYEEDKGRHSWGVLILENDESNLPAVVKCNGRETQYRGVSTCHSRAGLVQRIEFTQPVNYNFDPACNYEDVRMLEGDKVFEYKMPEGDCVTYFMTKKGEEKIAEHYDFGYTKIMIRGD